MNWLLKFGGKLKKSSTSAEASVDKTKTVADQQREALVDSGKEQFTKLLDMGLKIHEVSLQ